MKRKYYMGMLLALLVLIINQAYIQYQLHQKYHDDELINLAGRQRMLSQKLIYEMNMAKTQASYLPKAQATLKQWQKNHNALLRGDSVMRIEAIRSSEAKDIMQDIIQNITTAESYLMSIDESSIEQIEQNQNDFLDKMDKAVGLLEEEADHKLRNIIIVELLLSGLVILILVAEYYFVCLPAATEMEMVNNDLTRKTNLFKGIYDSNRAVNIVMDLNLNILAYNKAAKVQTRQYRDMDIEICKSFTDLVFKGTEAHFQNYFKLALQGKTNNTHWKMPTKDGYYQWMSITYSPVYDRNNKIIAVAFNSVNIHDRKMADLKAHYQEEKIKEMKQIQSHYIRGPLSKIMSIVEVIKMEDDDQAKIEMIGYLDDAAEELDEVIHRIVLGDQSFDHTES